MLGGGGQLLEVSRLLRRLFSKSSRSFGFLKELEIRQAALHGMAGSRCLPSDFRDLLVDCWLAFNLGDYRFVNLECVLLYLCWRGRRHVCALLSMLCARSM